VFDTANLFDSSNPIAGDIGLSGPNFDGEKYPDFYQENQSPNNFQSFQPPPTDISPMPTTSDTSSPSSRGVVSEPPTRIEKRKQNTLAARRYRQKRVDQMKQLEDALKEAEKERDALKVRVARLEGENGTLKQMLQGK